MQTIIPLDEVISSVDNFLVGLRLAASTLYAYRHFGFEYFRTGFSEAERTHFSEELAQTLVEDYYKKVLNGMKSERAFRLVRKAFELMKEFVDTGNIHYQDLSCWNIEHPCASFETALNDYLNILKVFGYSDLTIRGDCSGIRKFLLYMESLGKHSLNDLTDQDAENYLSILHEKWPSGMSTPICTLRRFFTILHENGKITYNIALAFDVVSASKNVVKKGFEPIEISAILAAVDRRTPLGKRNYAMIILAVHSGLRQIDVLNLKLQDIRWRDAEISIIQHKTNRQLVLPLDQATGDAIADYILHGRPISDSAFVFLRSVAPYTNLKVGSCIGSRIVQKYAAISGVTWVARERKGFHSFRRSLGKELLVNDVPLQTISEILGHANRNSAKQYLSIDTKHLRECALSLDGIMCERGEFLG